jgi:D-alanine-D-alanine ligase-like ATP-grasp enzyme
MRYPFASRIIEEVGPSMGIRVELEPEHGFAGELVFPNGRRHLFRNTNFNVNPAGSTEIAKDKAYTSHFLRKHGFHVPEGRTFFADKLNAHLPPGKRRGVRDAIDYALTLGLPVFVKPNNLSQGACVTKIHDAADLPAVAEEIFRRTTVMLVEQACPGRDYRVVVLGDRIISVYERVPLSVTGNGVHTIDELLVQAQQDLERQGRPNSEIDTTDPRIDLKLRALGLHRATVLQAGEHRFLLDNANLSTGGMSVDVTDAIHPSFADIAIRAMHALGLRLAGVDVLCDDIGSAAEGQTWNIIEINAAPGLDNYASLGEEQAERVRDLYRRILGFLADQGAPA